MDRSLIFSFVVVVLVGSASVSHANLLAQIYWHTMLPNTPMPAGIRELLRPDSGDEKPTSVAVGKGYNKLHDVPFFLWAAAAEELHDHPLLALVFQEKDLRPGSEMKLQFYETQPGSTFRTRLVADSIPFSSAQTAAIFKRLSIDPNSPKAEAMKKRWRRASRRRQTERRSSAPRRWNQWWISRRPSLGAT